MATDLLERLVMPALDDESIKYSVPHDFALTVKYMTEPAGSVEIYVIDKEIEPPLIEFRALHIAKFPKERADYAATVCNRLNARVIGKFLVDEIGDMEYQLEWPVLDGAQPGDAVRMLETALSGAVKFYPAIMKARWADIPIDEALEVDDGGGESPEPPGIMSDDDIRRLLEGGEIDGGDAE